VNQVEGPETGGAEEVSSAPPVSVREIFLTYADCDPAGIIYYASWFVAMERQLTEWFDAQGIRFERMRQELGSAPVTRATRCDYLSPAYVYDLVRVEMRVNRIGRSSYELGFTMIRDKDETTLARAAIVCVFVGSDARPAPLPESFRRVLERPASPPASPGERCAIATAS
jgi:acyl-CoA thioester hydrolase